MILIKFKQRDEAKDMMFIGYTIYADGRNLYGMPITNNFSYVDSVKDVKYQVKAHFFDKRAREIEFEILYPCPNCDGIGYC